MGSASEYLHMTKLRMVSYEEVHADGHLSRARNTLPLIKFILWSLSFEDMGGRSFDLFCTEASLLASGNPK
jgi:hypothetical protein